MDGAYFPLFRHFIGNYASIWRHYRATFSGSIANNVFSNIKSSSTISSIKSCFFYKRDNFFINFALIIGYHTSIWPRISQISGNKSEFQALVCMILKIFNFKHTTYSHLVLFRLFVGLHKINPVFLLISRRVHYWAMKKCYKISQHIKALIKPKQIFKSKPPKQNQ